MKALVQALSLSALVLFTSCAHHRSCSGDKSQCEMHKDKSCCKDKEQCPMKEEKKAEEKK